MSASHKDIGMNIRAAALLGLALLAAPVTAKTKMPAVVEGQIPQQPVDPGNYPYQLFVPKGYLTDKGKSYPLLIFLHGSGERGYDVAKVKVHGPPKIADRDPAFPFLTVSPLLGTDQDWDIAKLDRLVDHIAKTYRIDPARIYLTGLSRGGHATWRWAIAEPKRFAAVAPVAGRGNPGEACRLMDLPVWAFHGDRDNVVLPEGSFDMARAIRACGGRKVRLTIYPDLGHNAWDPAYDDPALYKWLLEQALPSPDPTKDKK